MLDPGQPPATGDRADDVVLPGHPTPQPLPARRTPRDDDDAARLAAWQKSQERTKRRAKLRANQKKAKLMQRQRQDPDAIGRAHPLAVVAGDGPIGERRFAIAVGGAVLVVLAALVGYLFTGFGLGDGSADTDVAGGFSTTDDLPVGANLGSASIEQLALSAVQLVGLDDDLRAECAGSGIIVGADGTILTNAHVVTSSQTCTFSSIGVALTVDNTKAAELRYKAQVVAVDPALDLAVLRMTESIDPSFGDGLPDSFPVAPLGDSDTVELGDGLRILGYPVIGGETITLTTGSVSGFTSQVGLGDRALIKTDAAISAGNSGGMAIDASGRVIGIPTKARASESGPAIDCRPLADTNADGAVDDGDNCVPVGGFLNGIRPINLALPLLESAATPKRSVRSSSRRSRSPDWT